MKQPKTIDIDGVRYERADSKPTGNRCVCVLDRGWIFAGDLTEENGRIVLTRAVNVQRWSSIGFDGMLRAPKGDNVTLKKLDHDVHFPSGAELFRCPVDKNWGL